MCAVMPCKVFQAYAQAVCYQAMLSVSGFKTALTPWGNRRWRVIVVARDTPKLQ